MKNAKTVNKKDVSIIISTVLEPDLISEAIEFSEEQILTIDMTKYKKQLQEEEKKLLKTEETAQKQAAKQEVKHESRIEDALRVKVGLLNNLMNFAGELVLARNQLVQIMSNKLGDNPGVEKNIRNFSDALRQSCRKIASVPGAGGGHAQASFDAEIEFLGKKLKEAFDIQLTEIKGLNSIVQNINMVTTLLQESIMQTRMQPISVVFSKFPRVIRDLAKKLGKDINLTQMGQEVELDKSIIELLSDPLTHLIRNCADHGVETPDIRAKAGKPAQGEVVLKAFQEGGKVIIEIIDDGTGINPDIIRAKAVEKGVITKEAAQTMSAKELQMLIFAPGFSTAQVVSDVSGRGVGMDVVKTNIERLGGTVEIESETGKGTTITLKLPLTLAIIPSLIIQSENRRFAIPQVGLDEVVRIRARDVATRIERVHDAEVLRLRGKLLPLVRLANVLGIATTFVDPHTGLSETERRTRWSDRRNTVTAEQDSAENGHHEFDDQRTGKSDRREHLHNAVKVVVLKSDAKHFGLVVDDVQDSEEIVVKPLPDYLKSVQCYAGATIMGDGKVAMILDPNGVAEMAKLKFEELDKDIAAEKARHDKEEKVKRENMLLFSIGGPELFAVDLSKVSRIEKREVSEIQRVGDKEFLKYENTSMRLFRLERYLPVQGASAQQDSMFVIVPKNTKHPLGFITARVDDTVETELSVDASSVKGAGIQGSSIIDKKMAIIIDVPSFLQTVESEFER
jgi:two-component system chemotaxis sensor kinase CheA